MVNGTISSTIPKLISKNAIKILFMITFTSIGNIGRLGNQIFQFSSGLGISKKLGHVFRLPEESFNISGDKDSYTGCKLLDCFKIPNEFIIPYHEIARSIKFTYQEKEFRYNKETEFISDGCDLYGYFQTEKYFIEYRDEIRNILLFHDNIIEECDKKLIVNENFVSVHVRRGDYLLSPDYHLPQSLDYYNRSMDMFDPESTFCIFSDDIEWCKVNFKGRKFIFVETKNPYHDLYLMSLHKKHIIANSSFSWWGSWLSDSEKTIAPSTWFGHNLKKDTTDIYCKNWIIV